MLAPAASTTLAGRRILVVEDELLAADEIVNTLLGNGVEVVGAAPSVRKALALIEAESALDAAVIDINLAGEMAYPIADALAARHTPFVFATAYDRSRLPHRYRNAPHCAKPLNPPILIRELMEALRSPPLKRRRLETDFEEFDPPVWVGRSPVRGGNVLLETLDPPLVVLLQECGLVIPLVPGRILRSPGVASAEVCFPSSGVISVSRSLRGGEAAESHLVGREGALGLSVALAVDPSRDWATVTVGGEALMVPNPAFRQFVEQHTALLAVVQRYQSDLIDELTQRAACNAAHHLPQRFAGWLLRCGARAGSDDFEVTQEHLSQVLSAQRTTISSVARHFKEAGVLSYARGRLKIIDWPKLERLACSCHREADVALRLPSI